MKEPAQLYIPQQGLFAVGRVLVTQMTSSDAAVDVSLSSS
jgi:hypothetical protein